MVSGSEVDVALLRAKELAMALAMIGQANGDLDVRNV